MKIKNPRPPAFLNFRVLAAFLLFLTAGMLTFFAFAGAQPDNNTQTIRSSRWLTRLASTLAIMTQSQPGGAVKTDKYPAERPQGAPQTAPAIPYSGPPHNLTPVTAVRTGKLRDMQAIDSATIINHYHIEPIPPKPPTQSGGGIGGSQQSVAGDVISAPGPTRLNFEGVAVGLAAAAATGHPPGV